MMIVIIRVMERITMRQRVFGVLTLCMSATALFLLHAQQDLAQNADRFDNSGQVIGTAEPVWIRQQNFTNRPTPRTSASR